MSQGSVPKVSGLNCPNCGAAVTIRAYEHTLNVVCESCLCVLDAKDPNLRILQQAKSKEKIQPRIPLGTRGKVRGDDVEVIGFQERTIHVDEMPYSWREYLLFNPYKGFRYLTEYDGHWNYIAPVKGVPELKPGTQPVASYLGEKYRHFQTATAVTTYVLGEFPWQVRVGDSVEVRDFVKPPRVLSSESTQDETTWSLGEYITGKSVWEAFKLPGSPPSPVGVYENQPSPYLGRPKEAWGMLAFFLLTLMVMGLAFSTFQRQQEVFRGTYKFPYAVEPSFVTNIFELGGRASNVEVSVSTDLENNWVYFSFALVNEDTGEAYDFGREVSYYHGHDSDGNWSEGSRHDSAILPGVPPGHYYLRVEPEMAAGAQPVYYDLAVKRDVPVWSYYLIAALLLIVPPVFISWHSVKFEHLRWQESDHPSVKSSGGDD